MTPEAVVDFHVQRFVCGTSSHASKDCKDSPKISTPSVSDTSDSKGRLDIKRTSLMISILPKVVVGIQQLQTELSWDAISVLPRLIDPTHKQGNHQHPL
mmetsp:Transcript_8046/g.16963  ORF Transcript_8046/g.16963 Transcript_8046/m.16963 type:complete len:99 (+) Transcript_8046:1027-1323(+)